MKIIFYVLLGLGLIVCQVSDFSVYKINNTGSLSRENIGHSYRVLQAIDAAKVSLLQSREQTKSDDEVHEVFQNLNAVVAGMPSQELRTSHLSRLLDHNRLEQDQHQILSILSEMNVAERTLLEERINQNLAIDEEAGRRAVFANYVDLFLIIIAVFFFVLERRTAGRIQKALTSSLAHVESVNQWLQQNLFKKDSRFKTVVHDLKNPLGSIKGFAELLHDEAGNNKSILEMTQIIQRISNSTLNLVGSVLEENAETDETSNAEELQIIECLRETCAFLEPVASNKKQRIHLQASTDKFKIHGSKLKIQDVFYNVVGNALKFGPPGSVVTVRHAEEDLFYLVQVKDQGPGFATEDHAKMFLQGCKLSAKPTGGETSTGIGLFSVKQTMDSLDGTIEATNNLEGGGCVTLRFPKEQILAPIVADFTETSPTT